MTRELAIVLVSLVAAAPVWAQSKRYPAEPKDPDVEAEHHSKVWEEALDPGRTPYAELVRDARGLASAGSVQDAEEAIGKLTKAIALLPRRPEAYALRGELELLLRRWASCADDLVAAEDRSPPDEKGERTKQQLDLGICQGRAGRYADAEHTLDRAASAQPRNPDLWMRLGEVRIALGKLDEAIGALGTAIQLEDTDATYAHYLLAAAYDRARLPGDAEREMRLGMARDPSFAAIETAPYPLLGVGELEYMMGLAYRYGQPRAEYALLYFRRFLALAGDSPWRRRAEEHLRELATVELPQTVERRSGTAAVDLEAARVALAHEMPAMRACLAKLPTTAVEVTVTRVGPRTPDTARDHPHYRVPPAGISVHEQLVIDGEPHDGIDVAQRCLEPILARVNLPVPRERDTWYVLAFLIVAP